MASPCRADMGIWLRGQDLNLRPSGYEPDELPDCSTPRQKVNYSGLREAGQRRPCFSDVPLNLRGMLGSRLEHRAWTRHQGPLFLAGTLPLQVEEEATVTVGMPKPCPFVSSGGSDRSGPLNKLSCAINNAST